ncbi:MAG TPA: chaperonin [Candidatus Latescibacteria bacterium]|nr:chaperonin [Candidatus Latescibacterota bacterium]|tara:strand:- start:848 stop:1255 length:408 start_codon:yes stop_codon:yes gene_type:complete
MKKGNKRLVVIGDRVLVKQEDLEDRTEVGLYLPQTVVEKEEIQSGRVVLTGPGIPLPQPQDTDDEPWRSVPTEPKYLPMQAEPGDYALFLKKMAVEIKFEGEKYLIIPHSSIMVLIREEEDILADIEGLDDIEDL